MPLHASNWNDIFVVQCVNTSNFNYVCVLLGHIRRVQLCHSYNVAIAWMNGPSKCIWSSYVYGEHTMTINVWCVRWDDGKWLPHQAIWRHAWPSFGPYSCYKEKYESKSFYNDMGWWYEGDAYPISCPCHVNSMWKWLHHVVMGVQTYLTLHNICLWTIFQRKVFSHVVTCVNLYTLYLLRWPFPLRVKRTWRYNMAQDHWFSSTRRKLVPFNHLLQLVMRKCIFKSFCLAIIGLWSWVGRSGNQNPMVGN